LWRRVLELRRRIVVSDLFEAQPASSTSEDALRAVGLHATQVSPIIASHGELVGVLSTHARRARTFSEEELARLDVLLERAADFLLQAPAEPARRRHEDAASTDEDQPPRHAQLDLRVAVGRALDLITPQIRANGQELTVCLGADPVWIAGDQRRLVEVFASLVRNAVTHTPPSGRLSVFVHVSCGWASVHVTDSGHGIAKKALDQIFAPRASSVGGHRRGEHELSLAEARRLIERHDGEITAQSDGPGHGSRFVVRLPTVMAYRSNRRA
jgi:signal transduction histidine kinase